ncbi:MAG: hypothetical protein GX131_13740 [candidate division WS1 bacterium]|nr:hypothetical protein [candidate division WS1 bacterium]
MKIRRSVAVVLAVLVIVGIAIALQVSSAQEMTTTGLERSAPTAVAAVATESVTEYEPDPFEPQRLRSSTVRVRRVAVIYSDGTVEVKPTN